MAVLVASSELEELLLDLPPDRGDAPRPVAAILQHRDATKERIMTAAAGTGAVIDAAEDTAPMAYGASPTNGTGQ